MDWDNKKQRDTFMHLHSNNPREGPGDAGSAARAFAIAKDAHFRATNRELTQILDVACGPGLQTRHLAELAPQADIHAVDRHLPFVEEVQQLIDSAELSSNVTAAQGDMMALDVPANSIDLIWCEGAVYIIGVAQALALWQPLLREGGCIAFTEPVFLKQNLPEAVVNNWAEYPVMTTEDGVAEWIANAGYSLLGSFVLPPSAWAAYYDPLQKRVTDLRRTYANDPESLAVIMEGQSEIDVWREYGEFFSYAFFVVTPKRA